MTQRIQTTCNYFRTALARYVRTIHTSYESSVIRVFAMWFIASTIFSFSEKIGSGVFVRGNCWGFFEDCKNIIVANPLPNGYGENIIFTIALGLLFLAGFYLYEKRYLALHSVLFVILIFKYVLLLFSGGLGNYDYYDIIMQTVFFTSLGSVWSLRFTFLFLYFIAGTIKIHDGWILGTYFTSMYLGLPLVKDYFVPLFTNIVILMQIGGAFLSFHKNKIIRAASLIYMLVFHLYSTLLVEYRYPITSVSLVLILFLIKEKDTVNTEENFNISHIVNKKNIATLLFLLCVLAGQMFPILFIQGDQKLTLEGNRYGLYMFEANHQFINSVKVNGKEQPAATWATYSANYRININEELKRTKKAYCVAGNNVEWSMFHSINGSPFYKIINKVNPCILTYKPFTHNEWILIDKASIQTEYESRKNVYGNHIKSYKITNNTNDGTIGAYELRKMKKNELTPIQGWLQERTKSLETLYWWLWTSVLLFMMYLGLKEINREK